MCRLLQLALAILVLLPSSESAACSLGYIPKLDDWLFLADAVVLASVESHLPMNYGSAQVYGDDHIVDLPREAFLKRSLGLAGFQTYQEESPDLIQESWGTVELRVLQVLWGTTDARHVSAFGTVGPYDRLRVDDIPTPRTQATNSAGGCIPSHFVEDAFHLVFIRNGEIMWIAGVPTAEPVADVDDPWVIWVLWYMENLRALGHD